MKIAMLLIYPPIAKPCEPPAGIAQLAGALHNHGLDFTLLDANLEGQLFLLANAGSAADTWSLRAQRNMVVNLNSLRDPDLYHNQDRYHRSVSDLNRLLEITGRSWGLALSLVNYQDPKCSPLRSNDLLRSAAHPEKNIFYPYFSARLTRLIDEKQPAMVGLSLNYLSQAPTAFAMAGFIKERYGLPLIMGGGLVTSWLRNPAWQDPFAGLIDHLVAGPGEGQMISCLGRVPGRFRHPPRYEELPIADYLAPGFILPYSASSGCYWNKCSFCPERAEENPYLPVPPGQVLDEIESLVTSTKPALLHFLDNALGPALMRGLIARPPGTKWYGFARITPELTDPDFCKGLRDSGCVMLKLGLESGDRSVLDAMHKGIGPDLAAQALNALKAAGVATYIYLLFGTPTESLTEARRTLDFVARHAGAITFLNLAVFNMPVCGPEARVLQRSTFYEGDLSLYTDFEHPRGWDRRAIRNFLDQEFKRHPAIVPILRRDPPLFTSNHAPFFIPSV